MLKKLRVAADKEREQNDLEYRKMLGEYLIEFLFLIILMFRQSDSIRVSSSTSSRQIRQICHNAKELTSKARTQRNESIFGSNG